MESSDDEGEILASYVTDYEFVDGRDQPISFSCIPLSCGTGDLDDSNLRVYLHGTTIDGLEQIYKQVIAWKYNLSSHKAEVFVLCKGNHWIQLLKPRKRFQVMVSSILVTLHFLHFVKNHPHAPAARIWNHLTAFSSYNVQPHEEDILSHIGLVKDAFKSDLNLPQSEYLCELLGEQPRKRKLAVTNTVDREPASKPKILLDEAEYFITDREPERKPIFVLDKVEKIDSLNPLEEEDPDEVQDLSLLDSSKGEEVKEDECLDFPDASQEEEELGEGVEDDEGKENEHNEEELEDEELQLFDTCCAFCDNGGDILCCEGPCMRSFHPTPAAGDYLCRSLGLSRAQVDSMPVFFCKNCQHKKHQCSICGKLGSSDNNSGVEVFRCVSATCGHFYHAHCVAKALYPENFSQEKSLESQVAGGDVFTCPAHKCVVCGRGEDRNLHALQFAICRRCPKVYHRKCLPRDISYERDDERNVLQRAWDDLLPKRILIYCLDHEINPDLGTPARNHIIFPGTCMVKDNHLTGNVGAKLILKNKEKRISMFNRLKRSPDKKLCQIRKKREVVCALMKRKGVQGAKSVSNVGSGFNNLRKTYFVEGSSRLSANLGTIQNKKACLSSISGGRIPALKLIKTENRAAMPKHVIVENSQERDIQQLEIERSINSLIEEVNSSFSINDIKSHQRAESCYTGSREIVEKSITMGKVEATVKAVHTALQKFDSGCSIEDAMDICGPIMLDQLAKWKHKLQLYLGPFLHGKRYTSYGRHFTKPDKLQEIVDRLHWYVQNGDTIVDFSCGSNDFSCLMRKKLQSAGKSCFFKNYDLHQAKNDFNFEKRDWFSVQKEELPDGSRLIIGLNPPFGVHAKLANQFIDKALKFRPKLLILIVPRETHRLDCKRHPYDLIWEDVYLLAGKSFYLPGSIDVNNKQLEQWNLVSPPLYLWSRPDWTQKHKEIAMTFEHLPRERGAIQLEQNVTPLAMSNYLMKENHDCYGDFSSLGNQHVDLFSVLDGIPEATHGYDETQLGNHLLGPQPQFVPLYAPEVPFLWPNEDGHP